jgi:uncharacterized protein (UPF0261 family)
MPRENGNIETLNASNGSNGVRLMPVLLIGTLDTKGREIQFVRDLLREHGVEPLVVDAGVLGEPAIQPDISRARVFAAAGTRWEAVRDAADRGRAVAAAAAGVAELARQLYAEGNVQGVLGLGGSAGTIIATSAMRALPFGLPKLMVSTLASGQTRPYVGVRDIAMLHSVVDISGINRISRTVLTNAAMAMVGMVTHHSPLTPGAPGSRGLDTHHSPLTTHHSPDKPLVAATMFGVTTPCVEAARKIIEAAGYEVLVFHATGTGGQAMESLIADGLIAGVLDITTTELADELVGGVLSAGPDRLTIAALKGVPQVISVGALDMVNFGPPDTVPAQFQGRRFYQHNPAVTLMRTTPQENDRLGLEIAQKASAAKGPTAVLLPLLGVSAIDKEGGPFCWPEADQALFRRIRGELSSRVELVEFDAHINDSSFAEAAANKLLELMRQDSKGK